MCGEKHNRSYQQGLERGLPPHVRGKEAQEEWVEQVPRITPACAGKSVSWYVMTSSTWDHPRVCGEKLTIGTGASGVGGITPRMCGEKPSSFFMSMRSAGSPPRMRGKGHRMPINVNQVRITPACAGKRLLAGQAYDPGKDHPRMCGEKPNSTRGYPFVSGSPPHVRGKGERKTGKTRRVGITPACAGKRMHQWCRKIANWDHPRMCGEKPLGLAPAGWPSGSPPHVRGKVDEEHIAEGRIRITPAYAGKSLTGNG